MEDKILYVSEAKHRSRLEQTINIILACQEPKRVMNIQGRTRLNYTTIQKIVSGLCKVGLMTRFVIRPKKLKLTQTDGKRKIYAYQSTPEAVEQAVLTKRHITKFKRMVGLE